MPQRLPRKLIVGLAVASALSFAVSMYLEWFQLDLLQKHPITANLLSGLIGFATGALTVAVGFNRFRERVTFQTNRIRLLSLLVGLEESVMEIVRKIPMRYQVSPRVGRLLKADPWSWDAASPGKMADRIDTDDERQARLNASGARSIQEDQAIYDAVLELMSDKLLQVISTFEVANPAITDAAWNSLIVLGSTGTGAAADRARAVRSMLLHLQEVLDRLSAEPAIKRFWQTVPQESLSSLRGLRRPLRDI